MTSGNPFGCKCPNCGSNTSVLDTRQAEDGAVHRRRRCRCGLRFNTIEQFHSWDARGEGRRPGRRSKFSPEALVLEEAKAAAKAVPVGERGVGVKHG